ncbi:MAG: S-layer homology domain-containing protein [Ruminococcaceae bacterium]|nr:S-layer homology domain-containing protein [Oscillospiraceae bacterium]
MKHACKRIVALLIAVVMIIGILPSAFAAKVGTFTDVKDSDWFAPSVEYVSENGLMNGMSNTTFEPNSTCTRAMAATVLYRIKDCPPAYEPASFTDLTADWYMNAVAWAEDEGVVNGVGNGKFAPDGLVTREQLLTMIWRFAGSPEASDDEAIEDFSDNKSVSAYAKDAFNWGIENEIINGKDGKLAPAGNATRAEFAKIIAAFDKLNISIPTDPTTPSEEPTSGSEEPTSGSEEPTTPSEEPTSGSENPSEPSAPLAGYTAIFNAANGKVMTSEVSEYTSSSTGITKKQFVSAAATLNADNKLETEATNVLLFKVETVDGITSFITPDGKYLSCDGTNMEIVDAANDNTEFVLEETEGGYFIRLANFLYNGVSAQYIEFYRDVFTCYGMGTDTSIYIFSFHELEGAVEPTSETDPTTESADPTSESEDPSEDPSEEPTEPKEGYVAIYNDANSKVMTSEISTYTSSSGTTKDQFKSAAATLNADGKLETEATNIALFKVETVDGITSFITEDGKYLSCDGTNMAIVDAANENTEFVLEETDGGYFIRLANFLYNGVSAQYIEFYRDVFTCYGMGNDTSIYTFTFREIAGAEEPSSETAPTTESTEPTSESEEPTEPKEGYVAIYNDANSKVMTSEVSEYTSSSSGITKKQLASAAATLNADNKLETEATNVLLFKVETVDGITSFITEDGKYLSCDGTNLEIVDAASENTEFVLEETDGGYFIRLANFLYNGTKAQYIEYYRDVFTCFGMGNDTSIYTFTFREIAGAEEPTSESEEPTSESEEPTEPKEGYVAIYNDANSKAMTTEISTYTSSSGTTKDQFKSAAATLNADGKLETEATNIALFKVETVDGITSFITEDGKYLSCDGTNMAIVDAANENTEFVLEETDGGYFIRLANFLYGGVSAQYIEFYRDVFTVYGMGNDTTIYTFTFRELAGAEEPTSESEEPTESTEPTSESEETTEPKEGYVAIYNDANSKVMTSEISTYTSSSGTTKDQFKSAVATLNADGKLETEATNVLLFKVETVDGITSFITEDGKYLSCDGTNMAIVDAANENTEFVLEEADGGYFIRLANFLYNGTKAQYIEFYRDVFTCYGMGNDTSIYTFTFREIAGAEEPSSETAPTTESTEPTSESEEPTVNPDEPTPVDFADLADGDVIVIVMHSSPEMTDKDYVLLNNFGATPAVNAAEFDGTFSDIMYWTVKIVDGQVYLCVGDVGLYAIDNNNGLRADAAPVAITMTEGYLSLNDPAGNVRYIGVYDNNMGDMSVVQNPNFRCYKNYTNNTKNQTTTLYLIGETGAEPTEPTSESEEPTESTEATEPTTESIETTEPIEGTVAIFNDANGKVMTTEISTYTSASGSTKNQLVSADAILNGENKLACEADNVALFKVETNDNGITSFITEDGKYLSCDGTNMALVDAASEYTEFVLEAVDGGYYIRLANVLYNEKAQYIEFYADVFTCYGMGTNTAIYTFTFREMADSICLHSWDEGTVTTEPTCTAAGVKTFTCTVCGASKTEEIAALGHSYVDDTCTICGATLGDTFVLTTQINNGAELVIYYPTDKLVLSTTASGTRLAGVSATPEGGVLTAPEGAAVMTVAYVNEEAFTLQTADGKFLTSAPTGNGLSFADIATDCSQWKLVAKEGTACFYIYNVGANYNGNYNQALEVYYSNFTTYGWKESNIYEFELYVKGAEISCIHVWDEGEVTSEPSCSAEGEIIYNCTLCDEVKVEIIPATDCTDADADNKCDDCGKILGGELTEVAFADLAEGDTIVIVMHSNPEMTDKDYVLLNNFGTTAASNAAIYDGTHDDTMYWTVTMVDGVMKLCPNGSSDFLYATNANNGLRVGKDDAGAIGYDATHGYLTVSDTKGNVRYIGVYDNNAGDVTQVPVANFRSYKLTSEGAIAANISNQTTTIYKLG